MRLEGYRQSIQCVFYNDVPEYPNGCSIDECEWTPLKEVECACGQRAAGHEPFRHHSWCSCLSGVIIIILINFITITITIIAPRRAVPQPRQELIALAATGEEFVFGCDAIVELHASIKRWKQI